MYLGNAARTGEVPGPGPAGAPERRWSVPIADGEDGSFWREPTVADGIAFLTGAIPRSEVGTGDDGKTVEYVLAVDAATGEERWRAATTASPDEYASPPAVADGLLYVGTTAYEPSPAPASGTPDPASGEPALLGGSLVAFDARTGAERWRVPTGGSGSSSPAVVDDVVYVGGADGAVAAFDATTGAPRWRTQVATPNPATLEDDGWVGTPAVADGLVYAVAAPNTLHVLDAATGAPRWTFDGPGTHLETPVVAGGLVYVGSNTFADDPDDPVPARLHALDATTGAEHWTHDVRHYVGPPTVGAGHVFLLDQGPEVVALDAATGAERGTFDVGDVVLSSSTPALVDGTLYVGGYHQGLFGAGFSFLGAGTSFFALDPATGEERWRIGTGDLSIGGVAVGAGLVYVVDPGDGADDPATLTAYGAD
jgi:outer membrane protein assembly factor BamB